LAAIADKLAQDKISAAAKVYFDFMMMFPLFKTTGAFCAPRDYTEMKE
jgi:hypothetical protein